MSDIPEKAARAASRAMGGYGFVMPVNWAGLLREHQQTTGSVAGILAVCTCGDAYDDRALHLADVIRAELRGQG